MTWSHWAISPFITGVFFILGVLTLFWVSQNWLISAFKAHHIQVNEDVFNDWYGLLYMLVFVFSMQSLIVGQPDSWIFMNFQLIALTFCGYFLNIRIRYYYLYPTLLLFMVFNHSYFYWESWGHGLTLMVFFTTLGFMRKRMNRWSHLFQICSYLLTCMGFGALLWWFMKFKFTLSWGTYWQEWAYFMIFEVLLYVYASTLSANSELKQNLVDFANHDALTKTENFAAYTTAINYQFQIRQKSGLELSMMMFDIDHFKQVNDTYGHSAGDQILQHVTQTAQTVFEANDTQITLYRTGGEEFNVLFPGYDLDAALPIANQLFSAINHLSVIVDKQRINLSISVGLATLSPDDQNATEFYDRVDANLYHSKRNGRMQITAK